MTEYIYNQFHWVIERLPWQEFQVLCLFYLNSAGYSASLGPIPGPDRAHDIYGEGLRGSFIAHCTIERKGLKQKFREDIVNGVKKCISLLQPKPEILFFSKQPVFQDPMAETKYIEERLLPELVGLDPRYQAMRPSIRTVSGSQLAREISNLNTDSSAHAFLTSRIKVALSYTVGSEDETALFYERPGASCTDEEFLSLLSRFSPLLPEELRNELMHNILLFAWDSIVFRPIFAARLLQEQAIPAPLQVLLMPLCAMSLGKSTSPKAICDAISTLSDIDFKMGATPTHQHLVLVARLIRQLAYNYRLVLTDRSIQATLMSCAKNAADFWHLFFLDLHLRNQCHHVYLPESFSIMLRNLSLEYFNARNQAPLTRLWPLILTPIETSRQYSATAFQSMLSDIAHECQSAVECRWCVSAFLRVMPLYAISEDELDYVDAIAALIDKFDRKLVRSSPYLQYLYLYNLLMGFLRSKDLHLLAKYEEAFIVRRQSLFSPQRTQLQIEYAASLYIACQFVPTKEISQTHFGRLLESRRELLVHPLFQNDLIFHKVKLQKPLSLENIRTVFGWLTEYTGSLFRTYVRPRISSNFLVAREFRATTRIYHHRRAFGDTILNASRAIIESRVEHRMPYYILALRTFSLIPRHQNIDLLLAYVTPACKADRYSIMRNARYVFEALYSCYFYGTQSERDEAIRIAKDIAKLADVGKSEPRLHWAYYAGIKYESDPTEQAFLKELGASCSKVSRKVHQLALKLGEEVSVIFPDEVISIAQEFSVKKSLFAQTLLYDMNNPDLWNIMGTTLMNSKVHGRHLALNIAGCCYSFAKCFARTRKDYDQKYCYNYIRCTSLEHELNCTTPSDFYFRDVWFYLSRKSAALFSFKEECTMSFFRLLQSNWDNLSEETRQIISEWMGNIPWIANVAKAAGLKLES